ncbi:MAG: FGGY-family carbohydrate kinase [Candidatus Hodarchaeota archaeon]
MVSPQLLTIDFGTSGIKCMSFTIAGKATIQQFTPITYLDSEGLMGIGKEFDATKTWAIICRMIRACIRDAKLAPRNIIAIAATSQRHGAVFLDGKGEVLYSGPNLDARGVFVQDTVLQDLESSCPPTGCWPPLLYSLCRLIWYKQNKPEIYKKIHHVLSISDWIAYELTGKAVTDPSQASNTQLMDIEKSVWSPEILEMADVSVDLLPPIHHSGTLIGHISNKASQATGLSPKTIVGVGGADTQCALLGSAIIKPGQACVVAGNTAPIQLITDHPIIDKTCKLWTGRFLIPKHWVIEANTGKVGEVLRWFVQNLIQPLTEIPTPQEAYAKVEALATQAEIGSHDAIALLGPQIMDAKDIATVRPAMFMFPPPASPVVTPVTIHDLARALFENICYAVRMNLNLIQQLAKISLSSCTIAGGLAQSQFWQQVLADVTGLEIQRGQEVEASSLGAAICAATAANEYDTLPLASKAMVKLQSSIHPRPEIRDKYNTYFTRWQALYKQSANL